MIFTAAQVKSIRVVLTMTPEQRELVLITPLPTFTAAQMQSVKTLLTMTPEQRELVLSGQANNASPYKPASPHVPLSSPGAGSVGGSAAGSVGGSAAGSVGGSGAGSVTGDEESVTSGGGSKRNRSTNKVGKLATYICKNYFKTPAMWSYLFNDNYCIDNDRLAKALTRVKVELNQEDQLLLQQQVDYHRSDFYRLIKRRISSQRSYRDTTKTKGKKWSPGKMAKTIDLTLISDDEDDESEDERETEDPKLVCVCA